ncbi:MAG: MmcQ/YjbR family DNA-binding protein [Spirochaetota bacterium]
MDLTDIRTYCASLPGSWEDFPFDDTTLVFKVEKKMYALSPTTGGMYINLKCDPDRAAALRDEYDFVSEGYHMNKRHWNTVKITPSVPDHLLKEWIHDSYTLVIESMSKRERDHYLLS